LVSFSYAAKTALPSSLSSISAQVSRFLWVFVLSSTNSNSSSLLINLRYRPPKPSRGISLRRGIWMDH
jgi:hypothetical protein